MTMTELFDTMEGRSEKESEDLEWSLWGVRKIILYQLASHGIKDIREHDIFELPMDEEIRKNLPLTKITVDGIDGEQ